MCAAILCTYHLACDEVCQIYLHERSQSESQMIEEQLYQNLLYH